MKTPLPIIETDTPVKNKNNHPTNEAEIESEIFTQDEFDLLSGSQPNIEHHFEEKLEDLGRRNDGLQQLLLYGNRIHSAFTRLSVGQHHPDYIEIKCCNTLLPLTNAILMVNDAWNKMSQSTIHKCSKHAGFIENHGSLPVESSEYEFDEGDDVPLSLQSRNLDSDFSAALEISEDYVDINRAIFSSENPPMKISYRTLMLEQLESDGEEGVKEEPLLTAEEALKAAELLSRFFHSNIENDNLTMAMSSIHT
ncbi:hypothetical protein HHI36_003365 [Cryptolaemus montrouzieri]|uniref:Uncharacterized protein n=1 Tax=Cryptolaemus montrouzieri TaxID=559131 RepID=A0ABD2PEN0_9CUCU